MEKKVVIPLLLIVLLPLVVLIYLAITKTTKDVSVPVSSIKKEKILVSYLSEDNNILHLSNYIREYLKSDLYEIKDSEVKNELYNFDSYDTVVIIYQVNNGVIPDLIYTFLQSYNLSNKNVILISIYNTNDVIDYKKINELLSNSTVNINSFDKNTYENIINWLKELGY